MFSEIKEITQTISKRYSNLSKRETQTYCPYICFSNITDSHLLQLKNQLYNEDFNFIDGRPYLGSNFSIKAIKTKATSSPVDRFVFLMEMSMRATDF
ncbi:hypothetical protein [Aquimarina sp. RZ0]|uniref:hypothetical protein n=1 Tax=Aquimarina sp. RZ0 TaxID=2607730 RepID=UPI0011F3B256|nr:hypothetical protein [Aquimarina sp. RZ0]KAA1245411.1 hypothetical protein F0000_12185 [Aquimarina sp. RZ0]